MGRIEPATLVDHIEPHQGDQVKFWDEANWQSSCTWHHSAVKQQLELLWQEGAADLADLRLDSPKAMRLARQTHRAPAVTGSDGWPIG
jgi:5-methylcytosine-specific restriction protein A